MKDKTQILIYTFHKCASMFVYQLVVRLARELRMAHYSTNNKGQQSLIRSHSWAHVIEHTPGHACFGPIRIGSSAPNFPADLSRFVVIGHVRDPRDMLTSGFYSYAYSHEGIDPQLVDQLQADGVDAFALKYSSDVLQSYDELIEARARAPHMRILKYERLVTDYPAWLEEFFGALRDLVPPPPLALGLIRRKADLPRTQGLLLEAFAGEFTVAAEDIRRHKRQVTPGDHRRKLAPQTIEVLNKQFAHVMEEFGYPV